MGKLGTAFLIGILIPGMVQATPNYHFVGWVNTVLPGGGSYLLGDYADGALQTALETGTFYIGYQNSARVPLTLDGVPEDLPAPATQLVYKKISRQVCTEVNKHKVCTTITSDGTTSIPISSVDISDSLYADWLQEFGIKYHFVNIFESYRKAAGPDSAIGNQMIDQTPTSDLFLAPFQWKNLKSFWVFPAILVSAAALIYNYQSTLNSGGFGTISPLNQTSQRLYDTTYLGVFPVGSGAPEEMFYRGFLQHELYGMVQSPFFSVSFSTLAYTFSHSGDDRASAAISGAYEGIVTHASGGQLSRAIAYHFWVDLLSGIYQVAIVRKQSGKAPLISFDFKF
jgi:membrane protease YdiL (CAAX protease family)